MFQYHHALILHLTFRTRADLAWMVEFLGMATAAHISDLPTKWQLKPPTMFKLMRCHWKLETRGQRGKTLLSNVFCHVFLGSRNFLRFASHQSYQGCAVCITVAWGKRPAWLYWWPSFLVVHQPNEGHWTAPTWKMDKHADIWWFMTSWETKFWNQNHHKIQGKSEVENPKSSLQMQNFNSDECVVCPGSRIK